MPTELAPDVRARVRSRQRTASPPAAARPAARVGGAQRFGSARLPARHHWVLEAALVVVALVAVLVLLLG